MFVCDVMFTKSIYSVMLLIMVSPHSFMVISKPLLVESGLFTTVVSIPLFHGGIVLPPGFAIQSSSYTKSFSHDTQHRNACISIICRAMVLICLN